MSFYTCLIVMLGGALGTLARHVVSVLTAPYSRAMPWGTILAINMVGSFIIAFFGTLTLAEGRFAASENMRLFVMVGLCGGYTTFSSFSLQTLELMRGGAWGRAMLTVALSVIVCVGAASVGHVVASHFNHNQPVQVAQLDGEEEA